MGQSTEELNVEIEQTRRRMAGDLDTLQDKVSPSSIIDRRKRAARERVGSVRDKVMGSAHSAASSTTGAAGSVKESVAGTGSDVASAAQDRFEGAPLAAGLVAFGAGVVLASLLPATRAEAEAAHRVVETAKEQGSPLVDQAKSAAQDVVANVQENAAQAAQQVKESAQDSAQTVADEGRSSAETVKDQAPGT